ncbi:MAG: PadR family transcriptional regulator [Bryobacteraceae bacterium]|nr:PadR family transcriptional regulator [Bryobacteraceae bacterium]
MPPSSNAEFLPGTLYMLVLRSLAGGPLHGYAIAKRIKDCSAEALSVEEGSLYPALNRMLAKGWLAAEWGVSESNRKARFYRLTPAGRNQLQKESREFDRLVRGIQLVMKNA